MFKLRNYFLVWLLASATLIVLIVPNLASAHLEQPDDSPAEILVVSNATNLNTEIVEANQPKKPWLSHQSAHYLQLLLIVGGTVAVIWRVRQIESLRRQGLLR